MKIAPIVSLAVAGLVGVTLGVIGTYSLGISSTVAPLPPHPVPLAVNDVGFVAPAAVHSASAVKADSFTNKTGLRAELFQETDEPDANGRYQWSLVLTDASKSIAYPFFTTNDLFAPSCRLEDDVEMADKRSDVLKSLHISCRFADGGGSSEERFAFHSSLNEVVHTFTCSEAGAEYVRKDVYLDDAASSICEMAPLN